MFIYVYQLTDTEYGAGCIKEACEAKGKIVEQWPIDTEQQIRYVTSYGSAYGDVSAKVTALGHLAMTVFNPEHGLDEPVLVNHEDVVYLLDEHKRAIAQQASDDLRVAREQKDKTIEAVTERLESEHRDVITKLGIERDKLIIDTERDLNDRLDSRRTDILDEYNGKPLFGRIASAIRLIFKRI